ncbi:(2Fe-2S)-binding protein [Rudaea cellulosilytica]|uniref:(2Fe-2S)-binding protein n=1 Tax=Rudaea cellulosilytica TaxID=540746 RepID=UPI000380BFB7|nr:(2Fe-2S)-binding protein [Rudaea cellulosilytica]
MNTTAKPVCLHVDGVAVEAPVGASVAAAIAQVTLRFGRRPGGGARAPLCGMGVCFECRVRIDGIDHQRACMTIVREGMRVETAMEPAHG